MRPAITIPVGIRKPCIPNTSIIEGITGKKLKGSHMKNGKAKITPSTLAAFLAASNIFRSLFACFLVTPVSSLRASVEPELLAFQIPQLIY
jgi:hypothetical protein